MSKAIPAFTSIYLKKKKIDKLQNHKKLMTKNEKRIGGKKVEIIFFSKVQKLQQRKLIFQILMNLIFIGGFYIEYLSIINISFA